jgi:hypothetical protein
MDKSVIVRTSDGHRVALSYVLVYPSKFLRECIQYGTASSELQLMFTYDMLMYIMAFCYEDGCRRKMIERWQPHPLQNAWDARRMQLEPGDWLIQLANAVWFLGIPWLQMAVMRELARRIKMLPVANVFASLRVPMPTKEEQLAFLHMEPWLDP